MLIRSGVQQIEDVYNLKRISKQHLNTRVIVFVRNLQLGAGELPSSVVIKLIDSNNQSYDLPAEDVRPLANSDLTQVTFRLPNALPPGKCVIDVRAQSRFSNSATFRIKS